MWRHRQDGLLSLVKVPARSVEVDDYLPRGLEIYLVIFFFCNRSRCLSSLKYDDVTEVTDMKLCLPSGCVQWDQCTCKVTLRVIFCWDLCVGRKETRGRDIGELRKASWPGLEFGLELVRFVYMG